MMNAIPHQGLAKIQPVAHNISVRRKNENCSINNIYANFIYVQMKYMEVQMSQKHGVSGATLILHFASFAPWREHLITDADINTLIIRPS